MAVIVEACSNMKVVYNWLYLTALVCVLICKHEVSGSFSPNITRPERGNGLRISCSLSAVSVQLRHDSDIQNSLLTQCRLDLGKCNPTFFGDWQNPVYNFGITNGAPWVDILSLNRTRDEGLWLCYESNNTQNKETLVLIVYGSPGGVSLVTPLPPVVELAEMSIMLQCKTDSCEYPEPSIMWYYQKGPNPISLSTGMIRRSNSTENCIQQELIHYSSLELSRGTNFPGNIPMTVNLLCGITHPSLNGTKFSAISNNVIFAVSLMFVNISGKTDVTQGVQANIACITSISRPPATVIWFIGTTEIMSGILTINSTDGNGSPFVESGLTINPNSLIHHGKEIFCQAFTPFDRKTSDKFALYVKVSLMFVNISGKRNVTEGVQANFTCITSISRPCATVTWFIGTTEITSGIHTINSTDVNGSPFVESRLTINSNSSIHHGKEIFCQAFTPFNNVTSDKLVLYVKVSVTEITLENSTAGTFVFYDGFSQNLKCTSSPSRPPPTIKWMLELQRESVELTDNITNTDVTNADFLYVRTSEITLTLRKENRNCKIFCSGNIDGQQNAAVSSKVTVDVWYMPNKPEVREHGASFPWLENQNGTLICNSSDYGNPTSNVSWTSKRGITDAKGHFVIKGLSWSDHRNMVSCQLVNRYTIDKDVHAVSESVYLNVEYSPRIQFNTTSPLTVNETQFLSVSCNATGNPNPNQIVWSVRRDPDGSLLRFENISRNDHGTYMCNATANSAKYGALRNQMEFNIIVQYAPVMNVTNVTSTLQDTTCLITCEAIGFPALYTFHPWKHMWGATTIRSGLQGIPSGSTSTSQNILKLERLSLQDMGTYVCSADNRIKGINGEFIQTAAVDLNILGVVLAFLSEENKKFAGGIGHFINISIPFYSYSNVTSFMFKRNGTAVMNTSRINTHLRSAVIDYKLHDRNIQLRAQEAYLYIQNLTWEDFDNYTLILENPQGPAQFIVTIDPIGPPLMVLRFYLNRVGNQVELHFDPGFNGGRIQEFVIQYKSETSLENWKNASILQETETQYQLPNGTFVVNITKPSPGSYIYRMYSWNEINRSPYSLEIRVFIPEVIIPDSSSTFSLPEVAGGIGAGVVVILMAVVALFLWRRYHHRSQHTDGTQKNQMNAKSVRHDAADRQDYEGLHINNTEASAYLQLNDITLEESRYANTRPPEKDSYEKLHPYTNTDIQMYSSLKIPKTSKDMTSEENREAKSRPPQNDSYETLHPYTNTDIQMYSSLKIPNIPKDSEKVYENTRIKTTDLTAEHQ